MLRKRLEFLRTHTRSNLITWQPMQRRIDELVEKLKKAYILIVTEISRLGKSTAEIIVAVFPLMTELARYLVILEQCLTAKIVALQN